ncbi:MAG: lamin tail domain-containing protein [archaeon]
MKKEKLILLLVVIFSLLIVEVSATVNETNAVLINEFTVDPQTDWDGDSVTSASDEWIELYNPGLSSINLEGWYLRLLDSSNATHVLSTIIPSGGYVVILNPSGSQNNDGRLELYDELDNLIDSVTYGDYDDGNVSDNAENGNSATTYDECLARYPDGADTGVDKADFTKTACTYADPNDISFTPVTITDLPVEPICAIETDNVTISAEITGSIAEAKVSIYTQGEWTEIIFPGTAGGTYSYTVSASELSGSTTFTWQFSVLDIKGNISYGELGFLPINSITSLLVFPSDPNGLNGWYTSEPQFELSNPESTEINYRWNGVHHTYVGPFGLEGTPNNGNVTGGTHVLAYSSIYIDSNCTEPEKEFMGKFDFKSPEIKELYPEPDSTVFNELPLTISAYIDEVYQGNSGVNLSSIIMKVNGADVPAVAEASGSLDAEVTYSANLTDDEYEVYLYIEDNSGRFSSKSWTFDLLTPVGFDLDINLPWDGVHMDRRQQFNITLTREAEELLFINHNDPSPRFKRLCRECDGFGYDRTRFKSLREGENELTFQAISYDGSAIEKTVLLTIDSKDPRIINSLPKSGLASGIFEVQFSEENPESLVINYGNSEVGFRNQEIDLSTECQKDRDYFCIKEISLEDYDGQGIDYSISLTDVAGNTDESRARTLEVDVSGPIINSFGYEVDGKYATFTLDVGESYLEEIVYIDYLESNPTERRLCNTLQDGICRQRISLQEGEHDIAIIVRDKAGNEAEASAIFFTDSKLPKIKRTEPRRGFASGIFTVTLEEVNPFKLFLNYGSIAEMRSVEVNLSTCEPDKKNFICSIETNLTDFEEQEITYWFNLTDVLGNSDESDPQFLSVDTTPPEVTFFSYAIMERELEFIIGIEDPNFNEISYKDRTDTNPRFKTLCSRLADGFCEKTKRFSAGEHVLDIIALDEAGNEATVFEGLTFVV